eukprot:384873_1
MNSGLFLNMLQIPFEETKDAFLSSLDHLTFNTRKIFNNDKIPFSAVTQSVFHSSFLLTQLSKMYPNLLKQMHIRAQLLHQRWGRGSFIMQKKLDMQSFSISSLSYFTGDNVFEWVEHFVQIDPLFKLNDYVVWFPLKAINVLFAAWFHAKFINDTSLYTYIMDLEFHVIVTTKQTLYCYCIVGPSMSKSLIIKNKYISVDKALTKYFNKHLHKIHTFSVRKFKKFLSKRTLKELQNHKYRNQILFSITQHYLSEKLKRDCDTTNDINKLKPIFESDIENLKCVAVSCYNRNMEYCRLPQFLGSIDNDAHEKAIKPIVETINADNFYTFTLSYNQNRLQRNDQCFPAVCESNENDPPVTDRFDKMYTIWMVTKMRELSNILGKEFKYYAKKCHASNQLQIVFGTRIKLMIFRQKLWDDTKCKYCKKKKKTKICSRCLSTWYCGKSHQKRDWQIHKTYCSDVMNYYLLWR